MLRIVMICLFATLSPQVQAQSLVGKWDCVGRDGPGRAIRTLQQYRANGQAYHQANIAVGDRRGRMDATIVVRGKWQLADEVIIEKFHRAKLSVLSLNNQDIIRTPVGRRIARELPKTMFGHTKQTRSKIKFINENQFRMQGNRIKGTCTRR